MRPDCHAGDRIVTQNGEGRAIAETTVTFDVLARDRASRVFNSVGDAASRSESRISRAGRVMAGVGRVAAGGLATGALAAGAAMFKFVGDARESERISRLTAAAIKSTGGAANVTAKQVSDLSTAISNKTGVDDEAVQSASNLLLTFTNVRNEVGKGNAVFDRATQAATNMAAALGKEPKDAALQLGKALNDPIKGVTALGRAGVQFSEQQREQIKTMVESGDILGAQKVILAELGTQFGGAAAAAGDPVDKLRTIVGNLGETVGTAVLPYVNRAAKAIGEFATEMMSGEGAGGRFRDILARVGDVVGAVGRWVMGTAVPALQSFAGFIRTEVVPRIQELAEKAGPQIRTALSGARDAFDSIRGAIERNLPQIRSIIGFLREMAERVLPILGPVAKAAFQQIGRQITVTIEVVGGLWKAFRFLAGVVLDVLGGIVNGAAKAFGWVPGIGPKLERAAGAFNRFRADVERAFAGIGDSGQQFGSDFAAGLAQGIARNSGAAVAVARGTANKIAAAARAELQSRSPSRVAIKIGETFPEGLAVGIRKGSDKAVDAVREMVEKVAGRLDILRERASGVASGVAESVRGVVDVSAIGAPVVVGQDAEGNDITRTPGVTETLAGFSAQAQQFASALAEMARKKLAPSLIAAVAAAGPASGLTAAQALASADAGQIASVNASIGAIDAFARSAANTVVKTTPLPEQIRREEKQLEKLDAILAAMRSDTVAEVRVKGDDLIVLVKRVMDEEARQAAAAARNGRRR